MLRETAAALRAEADRTDERRVLVLAGDREAGHDAAEAALAAAGVSRDAGVAVGTDGGTHFPDRAQTATDALLGTTREAVVLDCHDACRPNALGRVVGAVDGGGLLVLLAPPLATWPERRDGFDEALAAPPATVSDVSGHFRRRLVALLRAHRGIAIYDLDAEDLVSDGLTDPAPRLEREAVPLPEEPTFPTAAYEACLTADQAAALSALEALATGPTAVVLEADRGRGKSSAAGLAAGSLAAAGEDVLVTAPNYRSTAELFARASALCDTLDALADNPGERPREIHTAAGGTISFADPPAAVDRSTAADVVIVDEAAALPVRVLEGLLDASRVAFATTVHGYEGAGRGFDVRFRDRLESRDHAVREVRLEEPIRYAPGDPIEVWAFRALLLDARPAVDPLLSGATPSDAVHRMPDAEALLEDEWFLRETFGLLVAAHYRTEPNDLARLLDAPNVRVHALTVSGHVASVALVAREGGLEERTRATAYEGGRIRGNMIPDVLVSQLRDEDAGRPRGDRILRIATHPAVRDRGFGSRLLSAIRERTDADWIGSGFGATPRLVRFWAQNDFAAIHLSTTRNERSGEHSVIVLDPLSEAGRAIADRHARWFAERIGPQLADVLDDVDPDVVRAVLRAIDADPSPDLSAHQWRLVVGAAHGPAMYSVDPGPFVDLALAHLIAGDAALLEDREERLLVRKLLQGESWDRVADALSYPGTSAAMRALGDAFVPIVAARAPSQALTDADRYD